MSLAFRFALAVLLLTGCTTMTTPVLRNDTGEALGQLHFRGYVEMESSRIYPLVPAGSAPASVAQSGDVFQGSLMGFEGALGATDHLDLKAGGFVSGGGGGWRVGGKYQLMGASGHTMQGFALAAAADYGVYSGSGTVNYLTNTGTVSQVQTLAAQTWDLSVPVSWRFTQEFAVYSGLTYYHSNLNGSSGANAVSGQSNDMAWNLGIRVNVKNVESSLEMAYLRLYDPFSDSIRYLPYWGFAIGLTF